MHQSVPMRSIVPRTAFTSNHMSLLAQAPSDLILSKSISLAEALTGLNFHVRHLDGRVLQVR